MQKKTNSIISASGPEVYLDAIDLYAQEYEDSLKYPENLHKLSSSCFTGLIKYINKKMGFNGSVKDINILNDIWDIYVNLVYRYDQRPVIDEFALLIGVNRATIYDWSNGEYSNDWCDRLSCTRSNTVGKWLEECKLGRYKGAAAGNVGYIFLCKAVDGLVETAPVHVEAPRRQLTAEALPKLGQKDDDCM